MSEEVIEQWLTVNQIKEAGSALTENGIRNLLTRHPELFPTRGEGKRNSPTEILVTQENVGRFRIKIELDFRQREFLQRGASEVTFHTNSGEHTVLATETYGYGYFADIVTRVLPVSAVTTKGLEKSFDDLATCLGGPSKRIGGSRLIGLLVEVSNAVFPTDASLPVFLSGEAGVNLSEAKEYLPELIAKDELMRKLSVLGIEYIPRQKIPGLVRALRMKVHEVEEWPEEVDLRTESLRLKPAEEVSLVVPEQRKTRKAHQKSPKEKREYVPVKDEKAGGFWIPVPGILEKTGMHFTTLYAQARKGKVEKRDSPEGIEILVTPGNIEGLHLARTEFNALYAKARTSEGKRLTVEELRPVTGLCTATLRARFQRYKDELQVKRRKKGTGKAYEAIVTRENCGLLGIPQERYDTIPAEPAAQTVEMPATTARLETAVTQKSLATPSAPPEPPATLNRDILQPPTQTTQRTDRRDTKKTLEQTVSFTFSGKSHELSPLEAYTRAEVSSILKQVHSGVFTDTTIERVLKHYDAPNGLDGKRFIEYLRQVDGIMVLSSSSTKRSLESMGISATDFEPSQRLSQYSRTAPGISEPYILKSDLAAIKAYLQAQTTKLEPPEPPSQSPPTQPPLLTTPLPKKPSAPDLTELRAQNEGLEVAGRRQRRLDELGICPKGPLVNKLIGAGILIYQGSPEAVTASFDAYEKAMEGWRLFNPDSVRRAIQGPEVSWEEFTPKYLEPLKAKKIVKDLAEEYGVQGRNFYVVQEDMRFRDIFRALGLEPKPYPGRE